MRITKLAAAAAVGVLAMTSTVGPVAAVTDDTPSSYVLTFDPGADVDSVLVDLERSVSLVITHRFDHAVRGAVVQTSEVPEEMAMIPGVATVERDVEVALPPVEGEPAADPPGTPVPDPEDPTDPPDTTVPDPEDPTDPPDTTVPDPEDPTDPPDTTVPDPEDPTEPELPGILWHLDRIDQRQLPLDSSFTNPRTGKGVIAYVVDSGISPHQEFGDRLAPGTDLVGDGRGTADCDGHGTHVAGTIGGSTVGVAKEVTLVPVRMLDCTGTGSLGGLVGAFDWIAQNHPAGTPGVANLSLGGTANAVVEQAVRQLLSQGVTVVNAAGNEEVDACGTAIGLKVPGAIVVGSTGPADSRSSFSNYGSCIDLFAPGEDVVSSSALAPDAYEVKSGTSMAAPVVAGAAAALLQLDPWRTPADVESALLADATPDVVGDPGASSPNRLLFVDANRAASEPAPTATPPAPEVQAVTQVPESPVTAAALAFTGGDPRAMLVLALLLLCAGWLALGWGRRRERVEAAAIAAALARQHRSTGALQLVRTRRR